MHTKISRTNIHFYQQKFIAQKNTFQNPKNLQLTNTKNSALKPKNYSWRTTRHKTRRPVYKSCSRLAVQQLKRDQFARSKHFNDRVSTPNSNRNSIVFMLLQPEFEKTTWKTREGRFRFISRLFCRFLSVIILCPHQSEGAIAKSAPTRYIYITPFSFMFWHS
jgi:hypothetical protein